MPKLLLFPLFILLLLTVSCGEAVPANQQPGAANTAAENGCTVNESAISDPRRHRQLLDCLNSIHSQNRKIIELLERIATSMENPPPSR